MARRRIVLHSLEAMANGGIFDQVGGGFHRYATDAGWKVPHFEKMLYNQAYLTRLYVRAYALTGELRWRVVAERILAFVAREMTSPEGEAAVLYVERMPEEVAEEKELTVAELYAHLDGMRSALLKARNQRAYPLLDDKSIAAWDGLMTLHCVY